jgi:hypothetical protein
MLLYFVSPRHNEEIQAFVIQCAYSYDYSSDREICHSDNADCETTRHVKY